MWCPLQWLGSVEDGLECPATLKATSGGCGGHADDGLRQWEGLVVPDNSLVTWLRAWPCLAQRTRLGRVLEKLVPVCLAASRKRE